MSVPKYMPIHPDFYDIIKEQSVKSMKVFYFKDEAILGESKGEYIGIKVLQNGQYLLLRNDIPVRLDRIITINGIPGPAFEEYDNYSIECASCLSKE